MLGPWDWDPQKISLAFHAFPTPILVLAAVLVIGVYRQIVTGTTTSTSLDDIYCCNGDFASGCVRNVVPTCVRSRKTRGGVTIFWSKKKATTLYFMASTSIWTIWWIVFVHGRSSCNIGVLLFLWDITCVVYILYINLCTKSSSPPNTWTQLIKPSWIMENLRSLVASTSTSSPFCQP